MTSFVVILTFLVAAPHIVAPISKHPVLMVISFNGFRYDFVNEHTTPGMTELRHLGTYADYLPGTFPTKSVSTHFTIATGLYAEHHGVIDDIIYDPAKNSNIVEGYELYHYDEGVVPIWRLNEDFGPDRHSGTIMWPGSEYPYQGKNTTYWREFEPGVDFKDRVDTAIEWILDDEKPANLVMIYFEQPDMVEHVYGTKAPVVLKYLRETDHIAQYLTQQLKTNDLSNKVNTIFLSGHGMADMKPTGIINVPTLLPTGSEQHYHSAGSIATMHLTPQPAYQQLYFEALKQAADKLGTFRAYDQKSLPNAWHVTHNRRTPPILLIANEGHAFQDMQPLIQNYTESYNMTVTDETNFGVHGYDPALVKMRSFFMAHGPSIKIDHRIDPFELVDLHGLFCALLDVLPTRTDGSLASVRDIIITQDASLALVSAVLFIVVLVILALVLCLTVCVVRKFSERHTNSKDGLRLNCSLSELRDRETTERSYLLGSK